MRRRLTRRWRVVKWAGIAACVLLLLAWPLSLRWGLEFVSPRTLIVCNLGRIRLLRSDRPSFRGAGWRVIDTRRSKPRHFALPRTLGFHWPGVWRDTFGVGTNSPIVTIGCNLPLWLPLLAAAIPTAFLCLRDRRPPKGHCPSCGYDLTGNSSGVCPECGSDVPRGERPRGTAGNDNG